MHNKALLLGILNVTPDSFSDGGFFLEKEHAVHRGLELIEEGADILDIGGESTRPGAVSISAEEELRRVIPVIRELSTKTDIPISIDTSKAIVAQAAMEAGATIINDVSALGDPEMGKVAAATGAMLILMHCQGTPATMQQNPTYPNDDVVAAVMSFLSQVRKRALDEGVKKESIILDPGIGFGKTVEHNFALLRAIPELMQLGAPLLIGHSRKSFLKSVFPDSIAYNPTDCIETTFKVAAADDREEHDLTGVGRADCRRQPVGRAERERASQPAGAQSIAAAVEVKNRFLIPSIAITSLARYHGAMLFRVHDPRPHWEALRTIEMLLP
ncbi:MAG: dihydropteroate synthase [Chthoniobacterales bacterium]